MAEWRYHVTRPEVEHITYAAHVSGHHINLESLLIVSNGPNFFALWRLNQTVQT